MKKGFLFLLIVILGLVIWQKDIITKFIVQEFVFKNASEQVEPNSYYKKNNNFLLVQETSDFTPASKDEFNNILYTILNKGWNNFSFYCSFDYKDCANEFTDFIQNSEEVEAINNYVHPYNEFDNITISTNSFNKITVDINPLYSDQEIKSIDAKINDFIKNNVKDNMTDIDKIKIFHDYVINNTKYDSSFNIYTNKSLYPTHPYNAYGALIENSAICGGYSDAMAIYLNKLGIKNYKIASKEHIWNYIYVNNKWSHLDLTWDDPVTDKKTDMLIYDFFLIDTNQLEKIEITQHTYNKNLYLEAK